RRSLHSFALLALGAYPDQLEQMLIDAEPCPPADLPNQGLKATIGKFHDLVALPADQVVTVAMYASGVAMAAVLQVDSLYQALLSEEVEGAVDGDQTKRRAARPRSFVDFSRTQEVPALVHDLNDCAARRRNPAPRETQLIQYLLDRHQFPFSRDLQVHLDREASHFPY